MPSDIGGRLRLRRGAADLGGSRIREGEIRGVTCLDDGRIAVATDKNLLVLDDRGDRVQLVASTKASGCFHLLRVARGILVSGTSASSMKVYAFGAKDEKVKVLRRLRSPLNYRTLRVVAARVQDATDADEYEIGGLNEAFAGAFPAKEPRSK